MFSLFGVTITFMQILEALPKIYAVLKAIAGVYHDLTTSGTSKEAATVESMNLAGKAVAKLVYDAVGMAVPLPHKLSFEEEQALAARMSALGGG